ncbi:MAG: hypothetical protein HC915_07205 [Anaerolineae bacterium]|nr:hypothetical protein [Anaerolineae bacterium]
MEAVGTIYSASPCQDQRDFAGFFAALQVEGGNFAFFVSVEPLQPASLLSEGLREIQTMLDTIVFEIPELEATDEAE